MCREEAWLRCSAMFAHYWLRSGKAQSRAGALAIKAAAQLAWAMPAVLALVLAGCSKEEAPDAGAPEVLVTPVQQAQVPITNEWIGTVQGMVNANISAKVSGFVLSQDYTEGNLVKAGHCLLYTSRCV